ncbi:DUF3892 domain-containing protein [Granulicella sp. S190]|uniref:DUF3892 domain-containing protein n=1 Tax=Granulicella sp. S190 TaxID=1747226 RepID=UPI00131DD6C5|nr:DUF3892 domain-containing protein [Granulicella sp. S190]
MKTFLVNCTQKHVQHGRIESIGCIDITTNTEVRLTEADAIHQIEAKLASFIVRDAKGHEAVLEVEERDGRKFLITKRDHFVTDNLGALPECASKPIVVPPPYRPVAPARSHGVHGNWELL